MNAGRNLCALAGGAFLLVLPQFAQAQQASCITEREAGAMVGYVAPSLIEATRNRCGLELGEDGFLATGSARLADSFRVQRTKFWPDAKSGVMKLASARAEEGDDDLDVIATLPDEALAPFIDALIVQELAEEIPLKDCGKIERMMEAIAPIEPAVSSNLVAVIFALVDEDDEERLICPA